MELDSLVAKQRQDFAAKANLEALERKLFQSRCYPENIEEDEKIGGVYALFAEKELVYIGQSNDIHYRVLDPDHRDHSSDRRLLDVRQPAHKMSYHQEKTRSFLIGNRRRNRRSRLIA